MSWKRMVAALAILVAAVASVEAPSPAEAAAVGFPDTVKHWASDTIVWGVEEGVVNGFPDGRFQPDGEVTEAQFVAMLYRAFPSSKPTETKPRWYSAYYKQAAAWNWPVTATRPNVAVKRGQVARIVAASQGRQLTTDEAVIYLLERGLAQGRRSANGRIDFGAAETLTRAEAVQFVRNAAKLGTGIGPADQAPASDASDAAMTAAGVAIGDAERAVLDTLGAPNAKAMSEYGFTWSIYNEDYASFSMIGIEGGKVVGLYANGGALALRAVEADGLASDVVASFGSPLESIRKGNLLYAVGGDEEYDVFETESAYVTVFYDTADGGGVTGAQAIGKATEQELSGFYGDSSIARRDGFERVVFELANSARVVRGLTPFEWDDGAAGTARGHSLDMAANGFFEHTNLQGEGLGDRLKDDQVSFRSAGENIAFGQTSAIFAHEGWMNSLGHRNNMLGDFRLLGVGVAFAERNVPYYTQNFLTR
ncbi:CAP-associated domain-containing protein [Paenibacillus sp. TRM 82003]|nr:CAP-associated domain-containing protein [Paenibacillus sp. TRM 82003]